MFTPLVNSQVSFFQRGGASRQVGRDRQGCGHLHMARCSSGRCLSTNIAHLMHELGHQVGNTQFSGGGNYYSQFRRVSSRCFPTAYSAKKPNENFAEIFAAYLTRPELLSQGNADCKRAYAFFSDKVFRTNGRLASCQPQVKNQLMAAVAARRPGGIQLASMSAPSTNMQTAALAGPSAPYGGASLPSRAPSRIQVASDTSVPLVTR